MEEQPEKWNGSWGFVGYVRFTVCLLVASRE